MNNIKVPFLDLKKQYHSIKPEIDSAVMSIFENSSFILGKPVFDFEQAFAAAHNVKFCTALSSGTAGNHTVLWSLGIGPGDEVIIPVNTFIATVWGAVLCGAKPVFVDCCSDSCNIDPLLVEDAINGSTKAIVAVHLYGQPADMDPLSRIAEQHDLMLVEDAAQAHLAEYKGIKVGGIGIASSFSFYPGKNLGAYGEGGAVLSNYKSVDTKVKLIRDHGAVQKYSHICYGHNYRMEGIQGAVLGVKLQYLDKWTEQRRQKAALYKEQLKDLSEIVLPVEMPYAKHVYHLFVIRVEGNGKRDILAEYLKEKGITTGLHYPIPLHLQECFKDLGYRKGDFPAAEKLSASCLSLPIYPELADEQIEYVCKSIRDFFTGENLKSHNYMTMV